MARAGTADLTHGLTVGISLVAKFQPEPTAWAMYTTTSHAAQVTTTAASIVANVTVHDGARAHVGGGFGLMTQLQPASARHL